MPKQAQSRRPDPQSTTSLRGTEVLMLLDNPCDPDPRVSREARALASAGARVTILAWHREGEAPAHESTHGVSIERLPPQTRRQLGWRQIFFLSGFYRSVWQRLAHVRADVVVAHDFLLLPLGVAVAHHLGVPLVYDAHEIYRWMDTDRLPHLWLKASEQIERVLIERSVDAFVTVSEQRVEEYWSSHVRHKPIVVGNWYDPTSVDVEAVRAQFGLTDIPGPLIGYAGSMYPDRRLDLLLAAARQHPTMAVVLAGRGDPNVVRQVEKAAEELPNVTYLGWVSEAVQLLGACDALYYALDPAVPYARFAAPNTLYTAIAVDRPLLALAGGEVAWLGRHSRGVVLIDEPTPAALIAALDRLPARGVWGDMRTRYTWAKASQTYVDTIAELTDRGRRAQQHRP